MSFGDRIRSLRTQRNLKQSDLANAMQVSPQAVSKWERQETYPDITTLLRLARILNVTTDYLLGITEQDAGIFEATVLSTGIRRFAEQSSALSSKEVADQANVIFHHLTEAALNFDAVPIKYVGDGFLCFFSGPQHADRALKSAIKAKQVIKNEDLIITLNTGDIYLGTIGHRDYSSRDIIGETVNQSFLLIDWTARNSASGIAVTQSVVDHLTQSFVLKDFKSVKVPLMKKKVKVYPVAANQKRKGSP